MRKKDNVEAGSGQPVVRSRMRPQYTRVKCGACGKKGAYVNQGSLSFTRLYDVSCVYCKAQLTFVDSHAADIGRLEWPGSLEEAAKQLGEAAG